MKLNGYTIDWGTHGRQHMISNTISMAYVDYQQSVLLVVFVIIERVSLSLPFRVCALPMWMCVNVCFCSVVCVVVARGGSIWFEDYSHMLKFDFRGLFMFLLWLFPIIMIILSLSFSHLKHSSKYMDKESRGMHWFYWIKILLARFHSLFFCRRSLFGSIRLLYFLSA